MAAISLTVLAIQTIFTAIMLVEFDLLEAHAQTNLLSVASDYDQNKRKLIFVLPLMRGHYPDKARDCVFGVPFAAFSASDITKTSVSLNIQLIEQSSREAITDG